MGVGAIHASGRRPIRNKSAKSAKSAASRTSFFARQSPKVLSPKGAPGARWHHQPANRPVPALCGFQHHLSASPTESDGARRAVEDAAEVSTKQTDRND